MNFGDWQAQQKALKDEDRKRKSQAAEALKNFRGGGLSEEEMKRAALREQERKQKIEAERKLREYRATMSEEDARKLAEKEAEIRKKKETEEQLRALGTESSQNGGGDVFIEGAVSSKAQLFSSEAENGEAPATPSSISKSFPTDGAVPSNTPDMNAPSHPSPVDVDVLFMFGLISEDENPELDGYLLAIDSMTREKCGDQIGPNLGYPVVQRNEIDAGFRDPEGRPSVKRRMITVSIPLSSMDFELGNKVKKEIVESMRLAIRNDALRKKQ